MRLNTTENECVRAGGRGGLVIISMLVTALAALTLIATVPGPAGAARGRGGLPCQNVNLIPSGSNLASIDSATLCLMNRVRSLRHLAPLRWNPQLQRVATGQAADMVLGDYFGDNSRSGQTPLARILASRYPDGAVRLYTAQNIGWGTGAGGTPAGMLRAWMLSPPHRKIILTRDFRDVGIGVTPAVPAAIDRGIGGATYTVEFGVRTPKGTGRP